MMRYIRELRIVSITRPYRGSNGFLFLVRHRIYGPVYVCWKDLPEPADILQESPFRFVPWFSLRAGEFHCHVQVDTKFENPCAAMMSALHYVQRSIRTKGVPRNVPDPPESFVSAGVLIASLKRIELG